MKDITDMEKDRQYMKMALELAQKGMGFTAPNPMVGAVIVKSGGKLWHHVQNSQKVPPYMLLWNLAAITGNSLRVSMQSWNRGSDV